MNNDKLIEKLNEAEAVLDFITNTLVKIEDILDEYDAMLWFSHDESILKLFAVARAEYNKSK